MKTIYFNLNEEGRLDGYSFYNTRDEHKYSTNVNDDHEVLTIPFIYKYEDGELVKDVAYQQELINERNKPIGEDMNSLAILELAVEIEKIKEGMK